MDDLDSSLKDADCTKFLFTNLNGRSMNSSVDKHKIKDVFDNGVGFDGSFIADSANVAHNDRILMLHPPPPPKIIFS